MAEDLRILRFDIILQTNQALKSLTDLIKSTDDYNKRIELMKRLIQEFSNIHNITFREAARQLQEFQSILFKGGAGFQLPMTDALKSLENQVETVEKKTRSFGDTIRTALGFTLGSIAVRAIRSIITALKEMFNVAVDMERQLFRLEVATIALGRAGTSADMKNFQQFIKNLAEEFKIFSRVAVTEATANAALLTREFGFTQKQIEETTRVGAIMATLWSGDITEAVKSLTLAMTTGRTVGLNQYGASVTNTAIIERARLLGIEDTIEGLDRNTKAVIILQLAMESAIKTMEEAKDITEIAAGVTLELKASWTDLSGDMSSIFLPIWTDFLRSLLIGIERLEQISVIYRAVLAESLAILAAAALATTIAFQKMWDSILGRGQALSIDEFLEMTEAIRQELVGVFREGLGISLPEKSMSKFFDDEADDIGASAEEIEDIVKELADAIEREMLRMQQRTEELELKFAQRIETLELQFSQRRQRIVEDFALRREKTNRQFNVRAAEAARKFHQREEEEERKFQERLIRLREKFLFDLEDAVRERDARQVLRLIRRFNMEKGQLERQSQEEDRTRDDRFAEEMAAIERQRAERLRQLDIDEQLRLQHLAQDHALEMRQAAERHQQELEQLQRQSENRLELVALGLLQEHEITKEGLDAIMDTLLEQFGPSGLVESIYGFMLQRVGQVGAHMVQVFGGTLSEMAQLIGSVRFAPLGGGGGAGALPMAEGGTVIASRPTLAMFGERGLEMASFTPLGRAGTNVGRTMGGMPAGTGGGDGKLTVEVMLDPNLQTKIVDESMGRVAKVITNVRRSQQ